MTGFDEIDDGSLCFRVKMCVFVFLFLSKIISKIGRVRGLKTEHLF